MVATRNVVLQATLTNKSDGTPIAGKTYSFQHKLSSDTNFTPDGTAVTDPNGIASVPISALPLQTSLDFGASFAGDAGNDPSSGSITGFQLKAGTATALVAIPQ